jgi:hypothetical protein
MNMISLIATLLLTKLVSLTTRSRPVSINLTISCCCAILMTVGFSVIGIAHSYELITLGEYYFLSYIIKGFAPRLTIFFSKVC